MGQAHVPLREFYRGMDAGRDADFDHVDNRLYDQTRRALELLDGAPI